MPIQSQRTIGIDPGLTGGLALLEGERLIGAWPLPVIERKSKSGKVKRVLDPYALHVRLLGMTNAVVWIEAVSASPGMGAVSAFSFGHGAGVLDGVLGVMGFEVQRVAPATWKRALRVGVETGREQASKLWGADKWPRVKDDGMAEAALLALYGARLTTKGD